MNFPNFLTTLSNDIQIGVKNAQPIIGAFSPDTNLIAASAIQIIEQLKPTALPSATPASALTSSALVQAFAAVASVQQFIAAQPK